jgi:hypothetical protein
MTEILHRGRRRKSARRPFRGRLTSACFVQKGAHVGLPDVHPEMKEVMPIVNRLPDGG